MADGTSFSIDIETQAAGVEPAAAALARLADQLTGAGSAATQAADAVKAGESAYRQAESSANRAAQALEKIGLAADAQRGKLQAAMDAGDGSSADKAAAKLQNLLARQSEAADKSASATAAMNAQAAALDELQAAASSAAENEAALATQLENETDAAKAAAKAAEDVADATGGIDAAGASDGIKKLSQAMGPLGPKAINAGEGLKKLSDSLGAAGPFAAVALAVTAITAAVIASTAAIASWAVGLADGARSSKLLSDGIAGTVAGGRALDATISSLGSKVPQTREELLGMAGDLAKTGLKGEALSTALENAAVKAAKLKWGPDFKKQMLSLDSQSTRLKSNIAGIFGGLNIEGALGGMQSIVALFDSSTTTGKAMKVVFESLFQPVIDGAARMVPKVIAAFIQVEIWLMKAAIAVKPFSSKLAMIAEGFAVIAVVTVAALGIVIGIVLLAVAAAGALAYGFLYIMQTANAVGVELGKFGASVRDSIMTPIDSAVADLKAIDLAAVGKAMIDGLIGGVLGAGPALLAAITGLSTKAVTAAKTALGIHSPSTVFAEIGQNTVAGMTGAVDAGAGDVQSSLEKMVAPPEAKPGAASAGARAGGGGGKDLSGAVFNFYGVQGAQDAVGRFGEMLTQFLEGDAIKVGGGVPNV